MATIINLLGFKVNIIDNNSSINFGPSLSVDTLFSSKRNAGFGQENGDFSLVLAPLNVVVDPDVKDSNSAKGSFV